MKFILKITTSLSIGILASCQSVHPMPEPVTLKDALIETVQAIKEAKRETNDGTKIGLVPAEATVTFKVTGTKGGKFGGSAEGAVPNGPKLGVSFERTRSNSAENTIVLTLKSVYKTGDQPVPVDGPFFKNRVFMSEGEATKQLMKDPEFIRKMKAALKE